MHCCLDQFFASIDKQLLFANRLPVHAVFQSMTVVTTASPEEMAIDPRLLTDAEMVVN